MAAAASTPVLAQPVLDPLFTDGAVLQRDQPIHVRGRAEPGEAVRATLGGAMAQATADNQGRFELRFPAMPASRALTLEVTGKAGQARASDVLIGDVFLCSGQSNMELAVERAQDANSQIAASADSELRLFTIGRGAALEPQTVLAQTSGWRAAAPESAAKFSAACFYMAQDLRRSAGVPVGAIHASWGGSRISAWMSDTALAASGMRAAAELRALYVRDSAAASLASGRAWEAWWRASTGDRKGSEPWSAGATLDWKPVPRIAFWEDWGVAELQSFNGVLWFRKTVTLTPQQAGQAATLAIGPVDDADQTWLNGQPVGSGGNPGAPRLYSLPRGRLVAGRNVLIVNANDSFGKGGMPGPAESMMLTFADGSVEPIGEGWEYSIEQRALPRPPRAPWEDTAGAGTIYNAMIAPIGRIGLKGVAWYQGESDVGLPGYADRLRALMADWRQHFGVSDLPFAIVQLAGYGQMVSQPAPSGWADIREEQRRAVASDHGRAAITVTIDLGDPRDIHPGQKHEVGRRLARAMRSVAYGSAEPATGPQISAAERTDGGIALAFDGVTGQLSTYGSRHAIGFELCGTAPETCRYADARVEGQRVMVADDGRPATRVRYAWADSPVVNLYDAASLPVGPFEIIVP
ncbi:sialate O-acetylesterase [Blastomonas sp.]|uniref:sialate O-acetylesterase n=1 Tax=Blastomonas sp. TaxID=1909299 RepID=UPI00391ACD59